MRFDGIRFVVFDKKTSPGLRHSYVTALAWTPDGTLFIGTNGGGVSRLAAGRIEPVSLPRLDPHVVWALLTARDGSLWIGGTTGLGHLAGGALEVFDQTRGLLSGTVLSLAEDRDGSIWIGTTGGLNHLRGGSLESFTLKDGLTAKQVSALLALKDGSLLVGTSGGGLNRLKDGVVTPVSRSDGFEADNIRALLTDGDGRLWVGTYGNGLLRQGTTSGSDRAEVYAQKDGLVTNEVFSLFCDRQDPRGGVFIGGNGGLDRLHDGRVTHLGRANGMPSDLVRSLRAEGDDALFVGTADAGVARVALATDQVTDVWSTKRGLAHDRAWALLREPAGALLVGTAGGGLDRIEGGTVTHVAGLPPGGIHVLERDADGTLWVGLNGGGLVRLRDGNVRAFGRSDGLTNEAVLSLLRDGPALWVGTNGGGLFRLENDSLRGVGVENGLFDDVILSILDDGLNHLWMSSNKGVFRAKKSDLEEVARGKRTTVACVAYGVPDGLKSRECNGGSTPAAARTHDGKLWFPTIRGIAVVDPATLASERRAPPIVLEEVLAAGRKLFSNATEERTRNAVLPPRAKSLELRYAAPGVSTPDRVTFRYRLVGLHPDWIDAGSRRVAYFTNVPHGSYRFEVVARDADGLESPGEASFSFRVAPHLWETPAFFGASVFLGIAAAFGLHRARTWRLHQRQGELELVVEERTHGLAAAKKKSEEADHAKSAFLASMSHELRTPLNAIIGYAEMLEEEAQDSGAVEFLPDLRKIDAAGKHLLGLINDVLDLSKIEAVRMELAPETFDAGTLVNDVATTIRPLVEKNRNVLAVEGADAMGCDPRRPHALAADPVQPALERQQVHEGRLDHTDVPPERRRRRVGGGLRRAGKGTTFSVKLPAGNP